MFLFVLIFILMVALGVLGFLLYKEKKDRPKCSVAAQLVDDMLFVNKQSKHYQVMKWALDKVYTKLMNDVNANPQVKTKYALYEDRIDNKLLNQVDVGELITLLEELQAVCDVHNVSSIPGMMRCAEDLKNAGHVSSNPTLAQIKNNVERFDLKF